MKKCIVLDLDNTLWGGIVGEDGRDGIQLSTTPPGAAFVAFQQGLRDLYDRGVILAINSANNPNDALEVIRTNPNMILKEQHFAAMRINWNDKVQNLRELANELNIGLDSMVFLDDSPHNRENVRNFLPEVETPDLPTDPVEYTKFLHSLPYFNSIALTDEDKMRGNFYVTERLRKEQEKQHTDRSEFLKSLNIELHIAENDKTSVERLSQLTEKTNQFNNNKRPLFTTEIERYMMDGEYSVFHARAIDQFGDQGIIALALLRKDEKNWVFESLLMSCRVVGRGIEDAFVAHIAHIAQQNGAESISIIFTPTEKNELSRAFISRVFGETKNVLIKNINQPNWITII